jgi:arylsulfatase/arylsulfatase A
VRRGEDQPKPNVVFVLTDDQGWWDLGVHGNPVIETPNMDRIAAAGVRFTRFYAAPVCTPTRAGLMTGRCFQRTGAIDTFMGRDTLRADEVTLGDVFQREGYRTGLVGKWHLGRAGRPKGEADLPALHSGYGGRLERGG